MLSRNLRYTDAAFVSMVFDAAAANDLDAILKLDVELTQKGSYRALLFILINEAELQVIVGII